MDTESKRLAREILWYGHATCTHVVFGPIVPFMTPEGPVWQQFERKSVTVMLGAEDETASKGFRIPYP